MKDGSELVKDQAKELLTPEETQCEHCSVKVRMKIVCEGSELVSTDFEDGFSNQDSYKWQILKCLSCHEINIIQYFSSSNYEYTLDGETWIEPVESKLLYPASSKVTREGIFFEGQYFDAQKKLIEILASATHAVRIIDNYIDRSLLNILSVKPLSKIEILTRNLKNEKLFIEMSNSFLKQYGGLSVRVSSAFHDRFIIIDEREYYHFGASIKDLGNKGFMFSRIEEPMIVSLLDESWSKEWANAEIKV